MHVTLCDGACVVACGVHPWQQGKKAQAEDGDDEEAVALNVSYNYLLSMPIFSLTWEKVQALEEEAAEQAQQVAYLASTSSKTMWSDDLDKFLEVRLLGATALRSTPLLGHCLCSLLLVNTGPWLGLEAHMLYDHTQKRLGVWRCRFKSIW